MAEAYPELHAEALSANAPMREPAAFVARSGVPVYAECGGFMYLTEAIVDAEGQRWPMAGIFPTSTRMQKRLAKLGYVEVEGDDPEGWLAKGKRGGRGYEFRYSVMELTPETISRVYQEPADGYRVRSAVASYIHLHFLSCPGVAERFVQSCADWSAGGPK